ncbi:MAG: hypothetical protein A2539_06700 [Elusimicrobia bacterium RIFOXYD2_FULL_34_15]|nr:MAG: hypothetical protein A2539_06700 [Elusimicrobia bacterium RIFOXYD2_FULL_34_15]
MIYLFLLGFISFGYQIILLREFLVIFSDNELTIGIFLASWMLMSGLGSYLAGIFINRIKNPGKVFSNLLLLIALIMPLEIILIRIIKPFIQKVPTEILGIGPTILISLVVSVFLSILFGIWFILAVKMISEKAERPVGKYYGLETIGTVFGGLLISIVFIKLFNTIQISLFFTLIIFMVLYKFYSKKYLILLIITILCLLNSNNIENLSVKYQWKPFNLVESRDSIYGKIAVIKSGGEYDFYQNSNKIVTTELLSNNEEIVNFPLLLLKSPKDVLVIGGARNNVVEVLKYKISKVTYIEPNTVFLKFSKKYSKKDIENVFGDPRLEILQTDSRFFIKRTQNKFDCVIADIPPPFTGLANRYFTAEYFEEIKNILKENGIYIFPLLSSENYMSDELKFLSASIYKTLNGVFPNIYIVAGANNYFICSMKKQDINSKRLLREIRKRRIDVKYLTRYYLNYILRNDRTAKVKLWIIEKIDEVPSNYDFYPVCYFYGLNYWASFFGKGLVQKTFDTFTNHKLSFLILACTILIIFLSIMKKLYFETTLLIASFISIILELLIIFAFQSVYGYIYNKIGILLALCLFGIGAGSYITDKYLMKKNDNCLVIKKILFLNLIYAVLLPFVLKILTKNPFYTVSIFYVLIFLSGAFVGILFPLTVKGQGFIDEKQIGKYYAIDLFGAMLGTLLASLILIPVFGIINSCYLAAGFILLLLVRSCL